MNAAWAFALCLCLIKDKPRKSTVARKLSHPQLNPDYEPTVNLTHRLNWK